MKRLSMTMLKTNETITFTIRRGTKPPVDVTLRWPTDEEWIRRNRATVSRVRLLADGSQESEPADADAQADADAALFRAICKAPDPASLHEDYALVSVQVLDTGAIQSCSRSGDHFEVTFAALGVWGVPTVRTLHVLREPTKRQQMSYGGVRGRNRIRGGVIETRADMAIAGTIYDALVITTDGIEGPVPIHHKFAILGAIMAAVEAEEAEQESNEDEDDEAQGF